MDIMNQFSIPEADEDNYKSQAQAPLLSGVSNLKDKLFQPIKLHGTRNLEEEKAKAKLLQEQILRSPRRDYLINQSPEFGGAGLRPHTTLDPTAGSPAFGAKHIQMVDISSPEDELRPKKQRDVTSTLDQHVVSQIYKTLDFQST
jgi:hypothetical protein